jgi:hypothetical protein
MASRWAIRSTKGVGCRAPDRFSSMISLNQFGRVSLCAIKAFYVVIARIVAHPAIHCYPS